MAKKIEIIATIKDGVAIAWANYFNLAITAALYLITIWIPYINVGTTIAMCSLPAKMAKGNELDPLFIFESKYRRNMGEFLILMSLMIGAISVGMMFGIIPGLVITVAWSFATVLFVDQDMSPLEALMKSNKMTYGNKWRIIATEVLVVLAVLIAIGLVNAICNIGSITLLQTLGGLLTFLIFVFAVPAALGVEASVYSQLLDTIDTEEK